MSSLPHSRLFHTTNNAVVISGPHIQIVKTQTGEVVQSTATLDGSERDAVLKSGPIRCADVDTSFTHLVTSGEDKQLKVWRLVDLKLLNERELPKKPTEVHFTRDGQTILVSDKFGDIFSYPLEYKPSSSQSIPDATSESELKPRNQIISHENPSGGSLILGHTSLLTSFLLTEDEKYIVSADRDEHIRVSWYPQGYVIERYCLGHKKFVHTVHIPAFAPSVLVSGGGDPVLKLWDWMSGERLCDIPVQGVIEPFIKVHAPKGKWGKSADDGDGEMKVGRRKRRRARGKGKAKAGEEELEEEEDGRTKETEAEEREVLEEDVVMEINDSEETAPATSSHDAADREESEASQAPVLIIHRIASMDIPAQGQFLVFNAVGATAMFFCRFPSDPKSEEPPVVQSLQVHKPVIDFAIDETGRVWALVDGERESEVPTTQNLVRLLSWSSGQLVEDDSADPLLNSLNSACQIPATSDDIKNLDLYSALSSMPKHVDPEHDLFEGNQVADKKTLGKRKAKELTRREQARMKKKQAVLAKLQGQTDATGASREASASVAQEDERDNKKVKAADTVVNS
ncbi:WD40-repeat-containing domain protein [Cytidiella melzeri]|nr:WD40-repeat-containing domain protein [Cytidiella melzeri]